MEKRRGFVENARFNFGRNTFLEINITVSYDKGGGQTFVAPFLDTYDESRENIGLDRRIGSAYGCEFIRRLLRYFKINSLKDLEGNRVKVIREEGFSGRIDGFKVPYRDESFTISKINKEWGIDDKIKVFNK